MYAAVNISAPALPTSKPRYLMGVGTPGDFFDAVGAGIDLFDCVTPTRNARNHTAFTSQGRVNLRNEGFREDPRPLDPACDCVACTRFSRGVLRHLCQTNEMLAGTLLSLHNLRLFHTLLASMRDAITRGRLTALRDELVPSMTRRVGPSELD